MRSSKSRSRSKSNRNRPNGVNVVNRVFDSNGPEGKVRGTPQQIIDKYNQLTRDAQLSNDRVAAENFQQHAEHYLRMLNEAQREIDTRREEQERQNRERQAERDRERAERLERQEREATTDAASGEGPQPEIQDPRDAAAPVSESSGLVETPEGQTSAPETPEVKKAPSRKPRNRKPAAPKEPASDGMPDGNPDGHSEAKPDAEAKPKRSRAKPKPKPKPEEPQEAAE
ncbi:DUF4167 domain-containing protein [Phaeobacter sp. B1627]|uniref:DUF4167 domain-containing protein n=1 Tax=Phaeobacter sp. B1627 TaxID=2583809 RepID=UPI00111B69B5|nr:DUF4167 domain-containing protein [Phaeobacter sp. B1627]TNJ44005.1 DUF4167 domain-containing protein [Phaeobacter sp. B1627]